jgi:quinol monooxygenase YgiN
MGACLHGLAPILIYFQSMVICMLEIVPLPDKQKAVLEILRSVIDSTRGRHGCLGCACYEKHDDRRSVLYVEQWESQEALNRHIQSSLYNRIFSAMELAGEAPEIFFHEVANTRGMDQVEALRIGGARQAVPQ